MMKKLNKNSISALMATALLSAGLCGCTAVNSENINDSGSEEVSEVTKETEVSEQTGKTETAETEEISTAAAVTSGGAIDASDLFTDRDLKQTADLSGAEKITLTSGQDVEITKEGVYVLSGTAADVTVKVNAADDAKVQIVLDGVSITNTDSPCIYVVSADKVFITTTDSDNTLSVTGTFTADGTTNTDAVIFAKDDIVLNGTGTLTINSTDNGISGKDDIKITGGTIKITSESDAIEANDSVAVADGNITIVTGKDGIHAENDDDNTVGYVYICGGTFSIDADDDSIQATTVCQIDDGTFTISAAEAIEGTYVQINGGTYSIEASDDGINASYKSTAYTPTIEINGGNITINMGQGDTDAIDSNGDLYINGGTVNITAQSPFDYDGTGELNGGTVIVNGSEVTQLSNQMMGGMGGPGMQGEMPEGGMQGEIPEGEMPEGGMQGGPGMGGMGRR